MAQILVVEDSEDTLLMMHDMLHALGHTMIGASDGVEGIRRAFSMPRPDLILMDLMMPNASGISALKFIRSNPDFGTLPIIVLSAHPDVATIAREGGANDWIAKPIHMDELKTRIDKLLTPKEVQSKPESPAQ